MARSATTFQPGHRGAGGRPKGSLNRATIEIRDVARRLVEDRLYQKNLLIRLRKGTAGPMEAVVWAYAYGRPLQRLEHAGEIGLDFAAALKEAWASLQAAGDPRVPKPLGPAPTVIELLPQGTVPTNGRQDGRVYVGPADEEDDSEETWPGDVP